MKSEAADKFRRYEGKSFSKLVKQNLANNIVVPFHICRENAGRKTP